LGQVHEGQGLDSANLSMLLRTSPKGVMSNLSQIMGQVPRDRHVWKCDDVLDNRRKQVPREIRERKEMKRTHESMHDIFYDDVYVTWFSRDFMIDVSVCM
jgi:hypothetical protein